MYCIYVVMVTATDQVHAVYRGTASLRNAIRARDALTLRDQVAITHIAAPTGEEDDRAQLIKSRFKLAGLRDVRTDIAGNVSGRRLGTRDLPPLVVCAHMDTVFTRQTELRVIARDGRLYAPGIGDNARGLAAMLSLADSFAAERVTSEGPIDFLASTGEEGAGDLRGTKYFFSEHSDAVAMIALDGPGDTRVVNTALGCARFRIVFSGPGGHSWASHGAPNAAHAVGIATAALAKMPVPTSPRSTLSVTRIGGGVSVNSIPEQAWMEVDIRSVSERYLYMLADAVTRAAQSALEQINSQRMPATDGLRLDIESIGRRPCGHLENDHPLTQAAMRATEMVGREPELSVASTDANVPLGLGIPAIAIGGGGNGGDAHTTSEWYDNQGGALGIIRAATIILAVAGLPGV